MITFDIFKNLALSFPKAKEEPHFEKTSFSMKKKTFAKHNNKDKQAGIKLPHINQYVFCLTDKTIIYPVESKWGKKGWTIIEMEKVDEDLSTAALKTAYCEVAPQKLTAQIRAFNN